LYDFDLISAIICQNQCKLAKVRVSTHDFQCFHQTAYGINCSRIIMTDFLSSLTVLEVVFPSKNSMENKILNMLAEKGESLKLMWVPVHTGIEGNEAEDEAAKDALND
jgi:hypothetical protein